MLCIKVVDNKYIQNVVIKCPIILYSYFKIFSGKIGIPNWPDIVEFTDIYIFFNGETCLKRILYKPESCTYKPGIIFSVI